MNYTEALDYLYRQTPVFQRQGAKAYKPGLERIRRLCAYLGHPQEKFKSIHIAGTNGKGSSAHMLAAVLQMSGYRVGLHTSPHLHDFSERLRLDGIPAEPEWVVDFVSRHRTFLDELEGSFFEIVVGMAFQYFAEKEVDWAVVEVGLGGRLDATNILRPELCLITHIGFDHEAILGDTLPKIAREKAGIIKPGVPVVITERQAEVLPVFREVAAARRAPLHLAPDALSLRPLQEGFDVLGWGKKLTVRPGLRGSYQQKNLRGVLMALRVLKNTGKAAISEDAIQEGITHTVALTGLYGRWQRLAAAPLTIADVAHNPSGIREVLAALPVGFTQLRIVVAFSADKSLESILPLFPPEARYFFTQYDAPRTLPASALREKALLYGLHGEAYTSAPRALQDAQTDAEPEGVVLVLGSLFLVSELLQFERP